MSDDLLEREDTLRRAAARLDECAAYVAATLRKPTVIGTAYVSVAVDVTEFRKAVERMRRVGSPIPHG